MRAIYTLTIFAGALLLFLVQPMVGKLLLPWLGGTPAVWNTCMMFFQGALLAGYAYAHVLTRLRDPRRQVLLHGLLLAAALAALPIALPHGWAPPTETSPVPWLVAVLLLAVGLPFFVVSTSAPLLQRWFAATSDAGAGDPYFLYAASNAGSLMALLAYPLVVEPVLPLDLQSTFWAGGYAAFAALTVLCGMLLLRRPRAVVAGGAAEEPAATPGRWRYAKWIVLAFVPSSLMLGVTQHITTDVAAIPLLWVVPLALYLLTYVLAFARRRLVCPGLWSRLFVIAVIPSLAISVAWPTFPVTLGLGLHLGLFFMAAMMCHGGLARTRPHPRHLTGFYLAIAFGGALGGVFNAVVAPLVFDAVLEYPLVLAAAVLIRERGAFGRPDLAAARWVNRGLDGAIVAVTALAIVTQTSLPQLEILERRRTFFGVHRVAADASGDWVGYFQGTTLHGVQVGFDPREPLGYFHDGTGIGQVFLRLDGDPRLDRVGIIGLGAGSLAVRAEPGQQYTIYEIDPAVVEIARNDELFTYLSNMPQEPRIVLGDGRLSLAREPDDSFGLIVMDAFSSDAIPVHLLTAEAIDLYFDKLADDGLLAVNATNRHVDLGPLVAGLAADRGLVAYEWFASYAVPPSFEEGRLQARWLVMARDEEALAPLLVDPFWLPLPAYDRAPVWTDQFSNMTAVINWWDR